MEILDFEFGFMKESELDDLQKISFISKIFYLFSLQDWKNQLWMIDDYYKRYQNIFSELLKIDILDEIKFYFYLG